jgi:hypothetical protein
LMHSIFEGAFSAAHVLQTLIVFMVTRLHDLFFNLNAPGTIFVYSLEGCT